MARCMAYCLSFQLRVLTTNRASREIPAQANLRTLRLKKFRDAWTSQSIENFQKYKCLKHFLTNYCLKLPLTHLKDMILAQNTIFLHSLILSVYIYFEQANVDKLNRGSAVQLWKTSRQSYQIECYNKLFLWSPPFLSWNRSTVSTVQAAY